MVVTNPYVTNANAKFVVLRGLNQNNIFWTTNRPGHDARFTNDGQISYEIIAYTMTEEEAQTIWRENIPKFLLIA